MQSVILIANTFMGGVLVGMVLMYFRLRYLRTQTEWRFPNEQEGL